MVLLMLFLATAVLLLLGVVGPVFTADNTTPASPRFGRLTEQIIGQGHGKFYETTSRGNMFSGYATALTASTANSTAPGLTLYNPLSSGKRLALTKFGYGQDAVSTNKLGTGTLFHCIYSLNGPTATQSGIIPTGTPVIPTNTDIGAALNSAANLLSTATLNAAPKLLYPAINKSEVTVGTIGGNSQPNWEDMDGLIVLEQGAGWCTNSIAAAGTTPAEQIGVAWEEIQPG